jgi:hypothetical protein
MKEKQKSRVVRPQDLEALQNERQKLAALENEMQVALRPGRQPVPKRPRIWLIILFMAAVWGLFGLEHYYKHPFPRWFLTILAAILVTACSGFLVYSLKKGRIYIVPAWGGRGDWIYRDDTPLIYWFCMVLYLIWDSGCIYVLFELLTKGSL